MSKAVALGAIALYLSRVWVFPKRVVCADRYAATDGRVPKRLLGWTILGTACMILTVSACGGSDASKTEIVRLKSTPPIAFVRVRGPAGAVNYIAERLAAATFKKDQVGVFFAPSRYPRPRCSFSHTIRSTDAEDLQQWRGEKVRIAVYDSAGLFCQVLRLYIFRTAAGAG